MNLEHNGQVIWRITSPDPEHVVLSSKYVSRPSWTLEPDEAKSLAAFLAVAFPEAVAEVSRAAK